VKIRPRKTYKDLRRVKEDSKVFKCNDCGDNTSTKGEYYMVHDHVWNKAVNKGGMKDDHMLCVGCLEKRVGRKLHKGDFTDAAVNTRPFGVHSDRLTDRMNREPK
jgi:hypothetical protein